MKWGVVLHEPLHGFIVVQGTGTATLEVNLAQELAGISKNSLLQVLLDICKEYESLERGR